MGCISNKYYIGAGGCQCLQSDHVDQACFPSSHQSILGMCSRRLTSAKSDRAPILDFQFTLALLPVESWYESIVTAMQDLFVGVPVRLEHDSSAEYHNSCMTRHSIYGRYKAFTCIVILSSCACRLLLSMERQVILDVYCACSAKTRP